MLKHQMVFFKCIKFRFSSQLGCSKYQLQEQMSLLKYLNPENIQISTGLGQVTTENPFLG